MPRPATERADTPAPKRTRSDEVAANLRFEVTTGALRPGDQLSETALAERYGISRNTLRETFRTLTEEGLLTHRPHRGVFVAIPTLSAIIDIYRVRRLIEGGAVRASRPTHPAVATMAEIVDRARQLRGVGDWREVGTANVSFHAALVSLADSARLNSMFERISAELRLAFGLIDDPELLHAPYVDLNSEILDLLRAGERERAAEILDAYLIDSERAILAAYAAHLDGADAL